MAPAPGKTVMLAGMPRRLRATISRALNRLRPAPPLPTLRMGFTTQEDFAAFADRPEAFETYHRFEFEVAPWYPAQPDWTGRLGPLPGVSSMEASFDQDAARASVRLSTTIRLPAVDVVRAAYTLFYPARQHTGWGGDRTGVLPGAAAEDRWSIGGRLRPVMASVRWREFIDFDTVVDAAGEHRLDRVTSSMELIERPAGPQVRIDPRVHRPLGRRQPAEDTYSATAAIIGDRLVVRTGERVWLDTPAAGPITSSQYHGLFDVTDIDLSAIGTGHAASTRVAELAAFGAVLHDAPSGLDLAGDLAGLITRPLPAIGFLDHMNRSLGQVRAVMRNHTAALSTGNWPSVSVILSTQRADLLPRILEQLAAQDHPNLEVVIGCHGYRAPVRESLPEGVRDKVGPILEFDRSVIFGDVLAELSAAASGQFVSKVDDDDWYGPNHLTDMLTAWHYSQAQLVGRKLALVHLEETDTLVVRKFFVEDYRFKVAGGASLIARADLAAIGGWRSQRRAIDRGLWTRLTDAGGLHYGCSGPGYIHVRHTLGHTWAVENDHFQDEFAVEELSGLPKAAFGIL